APLHARREAGATTATQAGVLGRLDEVLGRGLQRPAKGGIALVVLVGPEGPGLRVVPELREDRGQLGRHGRHSPFSPLLSSSAKVVSPFACGSRPPGSSSGS